jgi:hypothetical protein
MPGGEQNTTAAAPVLDVLERVHEIRNASQAGQAAETESPSVGGASDFIRNRGHGALTAGRAVGRSTTAVQARNWGGALELGSGLDRRSGTGRLELLLRRGSLIHLLRWGRLAVRLLLLRLLIHLLLLVLLIRVLVDGWLLMAGNVGGLRVLVHGDCVLLLHLAGFEGLNACWKKSVCWLG